MNRFLRFYFAGLCLFVAAAAAVFTFDAQIMFRELNGTQMTNMTIMVVTFCAALGLLGYRRGE